MKGSLIITRHLDRKVNLIITAGLPLRKPI